MFRLKCLPRFYREAIEPLRSHFQWNHFLTFSWLLLIMMLHHGSGNLAQINSYMPLPYQMLTRLMACTYWKPDTVWFHLVSLVLRQIPAPENGMCFVIADATDAPKRSKLNPFAKKGKKSKHDPWLFGLHILVVSLHWDIWRIPVAFALVRPKTSPDYVKENELLRDLLPQVKVLLPNWVEQVVFLADAAYASKDNFRCLKKLNWFYVIACAKTWNLEDGTPLKNRLKHLQKNQFKRTWIPSTDGKRRRWFHVRIERLKLCELGDVSVVFSKMRRNDPSASARVILTNLPNLTARAVLMLYQRRWNTEVLFKELKSGLGMGQMQVTKDAGRVERSIYFSMMAYLCLLRISLKAHPNKTAWSVFQAKWDLMNLLFDERQDRLGFLDDSNPHQQMREAT